MSTLEGSVTVSHAWINDKLFKAGAFTSVSKSQRMHESDPKVQVTCGRRSDLNLSI